jgi:hypothetical protein
MQEIVNILVSIQWKIDVLTYVQHEKTIKVELLDLHHREPTVKNIIIKLFIKRIKLALI